MKTGIKKGIVACGVFIGTIAFSQAAYFETSPAPTCETSITRYLGVGSENDDVYTLQTVLARAGYLNVTPNGHFGPSTKAAVKAFQSDNGLPTSGVVGEATRNAINERACDTDVRGDTLSYNVYNPSYGYASGATSVTYVDTYDPYVRVVSPSSQSQVSYSPYLPSPQTTSLPQPSMTTSCATVSSLYSLGIATAELGQYAAEICALSPLEQQMFLAAAKEFATSAVLPTLPSVSSIPAAQSSGITSTHISYSPSIGYYYGVTPASGSLTITTPLAKAIYLENDTVQVAWSTNNIQAYGYQVYLENTSTGGSKLVASVSATSNTSTYNTTFTLSKDVLDAVCRGGCDNFQQGSFRVVVATPMTDIAGTTSLFKAAVSPITIKRPYAPGTVSITTSKNPISSGDKFKLYINIPTGASWDANLYGNYSVKIHATCPAAVAVVIAGLSCGQDFILPYAPTYFQSEVPTMVTNASWYPQVVTYTLTVTNLVGQVIGTASTDVNVNAAPINW